MSTLFPELQTSNPTEKKKKSSLFPELDNVDGEKSTPGSSLFPELNQNQPETSDQPSILDRIKSKLPSLEDVKNSVVDAALPKLPVEPESSQYPSLPPKKDNKLDFLTEKTADVSSPLIGPLIKTDLGKRAVQDVAAGMAGTVRGTLAAEPAIESFMGIKTPVKEPISNLAGVYDKLQKDLQPSNPNFIDQLIQGGASSAVFFLPGFGVAKGISALSNAGALAAKLAPYLGTAAMTVFEAATESGSVYQDRVEQIGEKAASDEAAKTFAYNIGLIGLTNHLADYFKVGKTVVQSILKAAPFEAIQEAGQSLISSSAKGEPPNLKEILTSGTIGLIFGGAMGGVGAAGMAGQEINPNLQKMVDDMIVEYRGRSGQPPANTEVLGGGTPPGSPPGPASPILPTPEGIVPRGELSTGLSTAIKPTKPVLPPSGAQFLANSMPKLAGIVENLSKTSNPESLQKSVTEAVTKAEAAKITGTDPAQAELAAIEHIDSQLRSGAIAPQIESQAPKKEAKFIGYQETGTDIPPFPLFNIPEGLPNAGSTVDLEGIKASGAEVPKIPSFKTWKAKNRVDETGMPIRKPGSVVSTVEVEGGKTVKITHQDALDMARSLAQEAKNENDLLRASREAEKLPKIRWTEDLAKLGDFDKSVFPNWAWKKYFSTNPIHDELSAVAQKRGVPEADLIRQITDSVRSESKIKSENPADYYDEGLRILEYEAQEGLPSSSAEPDYPELTPGGYPAAWQEQTSPENLFQVPQENLTQRYRRLVDEGKAQGLNPIQAIKYAKDKLSQPSQSVSGPKPQQIEFGTPGGVEGFGRGRQGEGELFEPKNPYQLELEFDKNLDEAYLNSKPEIDQAYGGKEEFKKALKSLEKNKGYSGDLRNLQRKMEIYRDLKEKGFHSIVGKEVRNATDIANAGAIARNPAFEIATFMFLKEGKIKAFHAFSLGVPELVPVPKALVDKVNALAEELGADEVVPGHNHPSGNNKPSDSDINVTLGFAKKIKKFKYQIVHNHEEFSIIHPDGSVTYHKYSEKQPNFLPGGLVDGASPSKIASYANKNFKENRAMVVYLDVQNQIHAHEYISLKSKNIPKVISERMRAYKVPRYAVVLSPKEGLPQGYVREMAYSLPHGLLDIVTLEKNGHTSLANTSGVPMFRPSAHAKGQFKGKDIFRFIEEASALPIEKVNELMKLSEPAGEYGPSPQWYSALESAVKDRMPNKSSGEQILGLIRNTPGVKQEEIDWLGLPEFLKDKTSVTKEEVLQFIRENNVEIKEVMKSEKPPEGKTDFGNLDIRTKFGKWQLPGGENYRELLLTLPPENPPGKGWDARELQRIKTGKPETFKSSHFPEENILAHIRFNDRVDAEGKKVLFIEEIQSDWHQKGREKGYSSSKELPENEKSELNRLYASKDHYVETNTEFPPFEKWVKDAPWYQAWLAGGAEKANALRLYEEWKSRGGYPGTQAKLEAEWLKTNDGKRYAELKSKADALYHGVPNAPFKKTWHELALKRMLRYATENGYDKIAWTTGEQQVDRYRESLQRAVDHIKWEKTDKGVHLIGYKNGVESVNTYEKENSISDAIGKSMGDKIKNSPENAGEFKGNDITVSDTGMAGFYDQMLPSFLNKYTKKWGGRVEKTNLQVPEMETSLTGEEGLSESFFEDVNTHSLDITPSMKESVMRGQALFESRAPYGGAGEPPKESGMTGASPSGEPIGTPSPSVYEKFLTNFYDRFNPIKYKAGKEIAPELKQAGGKYTRSYVMARLLNGKIRGISESLLNQIETNIKPLKNYEDRQILNTIYSLRNHIDLDRAGKTTSNITAQDAETALSQLKEKVGVERFNRISKVADNLASLQNDQGLNILVQGKVITPKTAQILRDRYPNYLRSEVLDKMLATINPDFKWADNGEPIGKINRSFLKTKEGTVMKINDDVLDIIRRSLITKVAAAQKQILIDQIAEDFGKEVGRSTFKEGKIVTEVKPDSIPQGYRKSSVKASGGRIFAVRSDVADLIEGLNQKQADFITKAMSSYNRVFRAGATTLRVPFTFNNIFRDVQEALFMNRKIPQNRSQFISYVRGAFHSLKNQLGISDKIYNDWKESGGAYGGAVSGIPKSVNLPYRIEPPRRKLGIAAQNAVALPFNMIAGLAEFSENTSRLAEWLRLEGAKIHPELRTLQSRDITVDFEKVGDAMKRINQLVPFLNANVQGKINSLRALRDQPVLSVGRIMAYIIMPVVLLYEYNRQFDNDKDIDPYIKANYWYANTGSTINQEGKRLPVLITVRKGEVGKTISYPVESLLEYAHKDLNFRQRLKDLSLQNTLDSVISTIVPPIIRVPIEEANNRNAWSGRQIVTPSIEDVKPEYQFKPSTTNTARRVGELTGLSPARIEHAVTGLFPAARQVMEAWDVLFRPKPEFPRERKRVYPIQSYIPVVQTPSGFFNQKEDLAKDFEKELASQTRTSNFLYEQAARSYRTNPTEKNRAKLERYSDTLDNQTKNRINKKLDKQESLKTKLPDERALLSIKKKYRKQYSDYIEAQ